MGAVRATAPPAEEIHVSFFVSGIPRSKGSTRSFLHKTSGKMVTLPDAKDLRLWETAVRIEAQRTWEGRPLLDEPVALDVTFYLPRPKKPRFPFPATKPDLEKIIRGITDSLTASILRDDCLVCRTVAEKRYAGELGPGCQIEIRTRRELWQR